MYMGEREHEERRKLQRINKGEVTTKEKDLYVQYGMPVSAIKT